MQAIIQKAKESDIEDLSGLFNLYRIFYKKNADIETAKKFLLERIQKKESIIFIATIENKIVGFTQLYPLFSSLSMKRSWLLNDLFILEEFRGKGISKQLIDAAKQLAKQTNAAGIMLETEKANTVGNKLYPSSGFVLYNKNNFYWWENI
ncbi:MAG TPA: GNAT family N-acetyltransferase [Puia sp.]|jgi:GNAT superfamily N-acetyltransferase|nr:GNAT family N-acetyltransferase [Puia sp.]